MVCLLFLLLLRMDSISFGFCMLGSVLVHSGHFAVIVLLFGFHRSVSAIDTL